MVTIAWLKVWKNCLFYIQTGSVNSFTFFVGFREGHGVTHTDQNSLNKVSNLI